MDGRNMKIKRIIYTTLLVIWMIVIFLFSNQDGNNSESTSDKVASNVINVYETVTNQEITKEKKFNLIEDTRLLVRKSAHFIIYFILGVLAYLTLTSYQIDKPILFSILFCFIYACSDEVHQMFLDGRSAQFIDVLIDTSGASIGCLLIKIFRKYRY